MRSERDGTSRLVHPPVQVWIDLSVLFPLPPHFKARHYPNGFQVHKAVPGSLSEWSLTDDGRWIGRVTFHLMSANRSTEVTQWVPGAVLLPTHLRRP